MRIYVAGVFCNNLGAWPIANENKACFRDFRYPWHLESYHYIGKTGAGAQRIRAYGDTLIFLDSGAFSAFTLGKKIDRAAYAEWIHRNGDIIECASVLDAIGDAEATAKNQQWFDDQGVSVLPCFHYGEPEEFLVHYVKNYPRITLGGMVPISTRNLRKWLDRLWQKHLTDSQGYPVVDVHGFGLTTFELMFRYPWHSVDSTSYVSGSKLGVIYLMFQGKQVALSIAKGSSSTKEFDQSFESLPSITQEALRAEITALGYSLENLQENYAQRDRFNIDYYRRCMEAGVSTFSAPIEQGLFDA